MPLEGLQIGHYRLLRMLGSGGMGEVYLAEDVQIGQQVAIKVIRAEASPYPDEKATQEATRLFLREAMAIAKLDHPHILPLYYYGEEILNGNTLTYLVMPYRPEGSLVDWLRRRTSSDLLSLHDVLHIIGQTAEALQHAHDREIIHQDVKPSNLLIRERKDVPNRPDILLADFGIAKSATATSSMSQVIRGTPTYMAPEQWAGQPVFATDQYALAVMAFELLTGRPPFQGGSVQMMYQHLNVQPSPPSTFNSRLPVDIDFVLLHALAKKPGERFASISAFFNAFELAIRSNEVSNSVIALRPLDSSRSFVEPMPNEADSGTDPSITSSGLPVEDQNAPDPAAPFQSDEAEISDSTAVPAIKLMRSNRSLDVSSAPRTGEVTGASNSTGGPGVNSGLSTASKPPTLVDDERQGHRKRRRLLAVPLITLAVLLISTSIVYAAHGGFSSIIERVFGTPSALVTITPMSADLKRTYTITAVIEKPDTLKHQVAARLLSSTTATQSNSVNTTGTGQSPATSATGSIDYTCQNLSQQSTPAGTILTGKDGIQVVTDQAMIFDCLLSSYTKSISAHAAQPGQNGNIPIGDIYFSNYGGGQGYKWTNNNAFTGGQDAQTFPAVRQSDIDGAANALIQANTPDPHKALQAQIHANEHLTSNPQCTPIVTSNHVAGDEATSVTVFVAFKCTGEVYDQQGGRAMAEEWLMQDAVKNPGVGYALVGRVVTTQAGSPTLNSDQTVSVPIITEGVWVYQFSSEQELALAKLIEGKRKEAVQSLLLHQPGVAKDQVQLMGGDGVTLPSDSKQLKFVLVHVSGK